MTDAPDFVLLDATGPRPAALLISFTLLSALLALNIILARAPGEVRFPRAQFVSEISLVGEILWLPTGPPRPNSRPSRETLFKADPEARKSSSLLVPNLQVEAAARTDPPAPMPPTLKLSLASLPSMDVLSSTRKLPPLPAGASQIAPGDSRVPATAALGVLPLPQLMAREAALAAGFAALPPARRSALPRLSIRVDADWLEALPQTKEELYFSVTRPQEESEVLAYLPATHSFILKRPLRPLWQIREAAQVPALATLRSAAAQQLGVSPELVGLYTWHPPVLENALRMFVLARLEHLGMQLGPSDVVTVRFASGPDGCLMSLEPIHAVSPQ
jgi:hypothetical protein